MGRREDRSLERGGEAETDRKEEHRERGSARGGASPPPSTHKVVLLSLSLAPSPASLGPPPHTHTPVPEGPWNLWTPMTRWALPPRCPWRRLGDPQGLLIHLYPLTLGTRTPGWPWTAADLTDTLTSLPAELCHLCPHFPALGPLSFPLWVCFLLSESF